MIVVSIVLMLAALSCSTLAVLAAEVPPRDIGMARWLVVAALIFGALAIYVAAVAI